MRHTAMLPNTKLTTATIAPNNEIPSAKAKAHTTCTATINNGTVPVVSTDVVTINKDTAASNIAAPVAKTTKDRSPSAAPTNHHPGPVSMLKTSSTTSSPVVNRITLYHTTFPRQTGPCFSTPHTIRPFARFLRISACGRMALLMRKNELCCGRILRFSLPAACLPVGRAGRCVNRRDESIFETGSSFPQHRLRWRHPHAVLWGRCHRVAAEKKRQTPLGHAGRTVPALFVALPDSMLPANA